MYYKKDELMDKESNEWMEGWRMNGLMYAARGKLINLLFSIDIR